MKSNKDKDVIRMNKTLETGLLTIFLSLSSANGLAKDHDHTHHDGHDVQDNHNAEFQFKIGSGSMKRFIPVDCDLLGKDGKLTSDFIKNMGVWGHLEGIEKRMGSNVSEAAKIFTFKQHLKPHGISGETIDKAADHCREHYPE